MKRILLLMILSCFAAVGFAQTTYYWVAGNGTFSNLTGANWNTTPGGSPAVTRSATNDILVFDGVEVIIDLPSSATIGKLELRNGADLTIRRSTSSANGTSTLTLAGISNAGLLADNSKLRIAGDGSHAAILTFAAASTGTIVNNAEVYVTGTASNRITVPSVSALTFETGTKAFVNSAGNPFNNNTNSVDMGVRFKAGSSLHYRGGLSPQGNTSTGKILNFEKGSALVMETNYSTSINLFSNKNLANLVISNGSTVTLNENFYRVDNLTIEPGSAFYIRATGTSPIAGNILNNGTFGSAATISSSQLVMIGVGAQLISGSGTFSNLGGIIVSTDAQVTLATSLNLVGTSTSSITGLLNTAGHSLTGSSNLQFRASAVTNSNTASVTAGNNVLTFPTTEDYDAAGVSIGLKVVGAGIPDDTYIIATSSGNRQITLSNAPTTTIGAASLTISSGSPTLRTAHVNGANGAVNISGTNFTYGSNTNFIFDAATTTPFPTNTSGGSIVYGDVVINAAVTSNRSVSINGKLTLNNAKFSVQENDVITFGPGATFDGTIGSSAYIVTSANAATGAVGVIKLSGLAASTLIPVGTATNYTPVTLTPTAASNFDVNVFTGATADATANGTALSAAQKLRMIDAVWNINRTSGSGDVDVTLAWNNALKGADFATFSSAQIGIAAYTSGSYGTFTGSGNAAANTATLTTSSFSPFVIGEANTTLPLTLIGFTAKESLNSVKLAWQTTDEVNLKNYILQHRSAKGFENIYTVAANNKLGVFNYDYLHLNPVAGANYYRLVGVDLDGTTHESDIKVVNVAVNKIAVYPNPVGQKNITVTGVVKGDVIKLFNIQGQVIATKTSSGNEVLEIDVQNIQTGTYILLIENGGKITNTKKVIKI